MEVENAAPSRAEKAEVTVVNKAEPPTLFDMVESSDRADEVNSGSVDPSQDNMLKITGDGRKLGLDPRLISPDFEDNPNTKLNVCVNNVFDIYTTQQKTSLLKLFFVTSVCRQKTQAMTPQKSKTITRVLRNLTLLRKQASFACMTT